jgi:predicted outer membrane protein
LGAVALAGLEFFSDLPAMAQERTAPPFDPIRFFAFAASSAEFQMKAASIASARDTRPEAKAFATAMLQFREEQRRRLQAAAEGTGVRVPAPDLEPEHRVVLENLEPLDYLALTRRYMEVQLQALEQEVRGYEAAVREGQGSVRGFAQGSLPAIQRLREEARQVLATVAS